MIQSLTYAFRFWSTFQYQEGSSVLLSDFKDVIVSPKDRITKEEVLLKRAFPGVEKGRKFEGKNSFS